MRSIKHSLTVKIALPVLVLAIGLGVSLYLFVLTTISGFTEDEIERDLKSLSHRLYNICNTTFDNLLQTGLANDPEAVLIKQALTLGQFEDFFRQENLHGLIYKSIMEELILVTDLPKKSEDIIKETFTEGLLVSLGGEAKGYYSYHFDFVPWEWHIIIIKSEKEYAALIKQVQRLHLYTLVLLIVSCFLLVFFIRKSISRPINSIIKPLKKNQKPKYRGIDVFEYLSDTIAQMMESLKQSEEKYRSLVETTSDFVWELDKNHKYTYASPTIQEILGYQPEEILGKTPYHFMPPDEAKRVAERIRDLSTLKLPFDHLENKNTHKDGKQIIIETSGVPILDQNRQLIGFRGIGRDITDRLRTEKERKQLEYQLQQLQKLEAIGTLAGGIAHDFNNLLSIILGNISLTEISIDVDPQTKKILKEAEKASFRAQELTNQLLTFAKGGAPIKEFGSVEELVRDSVNSVLKDSMVTCRFDISNQLNIVKFDGRQMRQAIKNLIKNSKDSMTQGGMIEVHVENYQIEPEKSYPGIPLPDGNYVKIMIQDYGIGIPKKHIDKVFDPYFSTKEMGTQKGMGLGLALTHSIINKHNGHITVDSDEGKGTTFAIYIPAFEKNVQDQITIKVHKTEKPKQPTKQILLMDDEEMIRILSQQMLKKLGYDTILAMNGTEAIQKYKDSLENGNPFDFVILDLTIKGGLGGRETIKKLRDLDPNICAIVSSGYSTDPVMTHYQNFGFISALPKPYTIDELKSVLDSMNRE